MLATPPLRSRAAWCRLLSWHPAAAEECARHEEGAGDGGGLSFARGLSARVLEARRRTIAAASPDSEAAAWVRAQSWWW